MTKKSSQKSNKPASKKRTSPGKNVFLMLALVPLIFGLIFVGAWVIDVELLEDAQSQVTVGIFFFLLSFVASNALQKRFRLAAGWGLLAVADLVLLAWLNLWAQAVALVLGLVGFVFVGVEFYRQYKLNKADQGNKKS